MHSVKPVSVDEEHKRLLITVKNALVIAKVKEVIYLKQLETCIGNGIDSWVYMSMKALYGLRQISRKWYLTLQKSHSRLVLFSQITIRCCMYRPPIER